MQIVDYELIAIWSSVNLEPTALTGSGSFIKFMIQL